jgi:hypothetical protein
MWYLLCTHVATTCQQQTPGYVDEIWAEPNSACPQENEEGQTSYTPYAWTGGPPSPRMELLDLQDPLRPGRAAGRPS